jgi:hypothetical protein
MVLDSFHAKNVLVLEEVRTLNFTKFGESRIDNHLDPRFKTRLPSVALTCLHAPMNSVGRQATIVRIELLRS